MRSIDRRKNKKPILLISSAAIILVGGGLAYLIVTKPFDKKEPIDVATRPANDVDYSPPSQVELDNAASQKNDIIKAAEGNQNTGSDIVASISRADQLGPGQPLNIRVQIEGTNKGNCLVVLTKPGQATISKTFEVVFEATSSRCLDADIPISEFNDSGQWTLRIIVEDNTRQSEPIEQTVMVVK